MLNDIINFILEVLNDMVEGVLDFLPDSPIQEIEFPENSIFADVMGWINYFIPLQGMLSIMTTYLAAVMVWYTVRWVMRLGQYID